MDKIKILKVEPGKPPCVKEIANDFKASQVEVEREGLDMERLRNGVYGANRAFPEADYLSDEIYRYDRDTHRLSVIPGSVQEEQAGMVLYQ